MKRIIIASIMLLGVIFSQAVLKTGDARLSPRLLNYQGYLTDTLGNPITNPGIAMTFSIFDAATAGNQKWTEIQASVSVDKGIFHVLLGSVTLIPDSVFVNSANRWLQLNVAGQVLSPRTRIASAPYAYTATYSDTAQYARNSTPDKDWTYRITDGADTTLQSGSRWGLARAGNTLYGAHDSTHVCLGVEGTTGTDGYDYEYCTVGGGLGNTSEGSYATIAGGGANRACSTAAFVGGGWQNLVYGDYASIIGGRWNTITGDLAFIGGGQGNNAYGIWATIGGGRNNFINDSGSTIAGGYINSINSNYSSIGGGYADSAMGDFSAVPGGRGNYAFTNSFAAGTHAKARHSGTFVWADNAGSNFSTTGEKQFLVRAGGGVGIGLNSPICQLDVNGDVSIRGSVQGDWAISSHSLDTWYQNGNYPAWLMVDASINSSSSLYKAVIDQGPSQSSFTSYYVGSPFEWTEMIPIQANYYYRVRRQSNLAIRGIYLYRM